MIKKKLKAYLIKKQKWESFLYYYFLVSQSPYLINFGFQRIFGVNRKCRWAVHYSSKIICPDKFKIEISSARSLAVSGGIYIQAINNVVIGKEVLIAPGVKIISSNHDFFSREKSNMECPPIVIGDNSWLGANVIILPGVVLGSNTIVGAGAIVTKSFSEGYVIIAGNPAKIIRIL